MNNNDKITKLERQILLYDLMSDEYAFHGRQEVFRRRFVSNLRMLQRDLKDLRDAGLLSMKYDSTHDQYNSNLGKNETLTFNDAVTGRRRSHLLRLRRLCILYSCLETSDPDDLVNYEIEVKDYKYAKKHPEEYPPEWIVEPSFPELICARKQYFALFPNVSERTMWRDFNVLKHLGMPIKYYRKYGVYLLDY